MNLFEFRCPNGCTVQADVAHVGLQTVCPTCGQAMLIPAPADGEPSSQGAPPVPTPPLPPSQPPPAFTPPAPLPSSKRPRVTPPDIQLGPKSKDVSAPPELEHPTDLLHIPCPNGHVLETPRDMLRQQVMCPHCSAKFTLREKNSVEHQNRARIASETAQRKIAQNWLNFAIVMAVICGIGAALMVWLGN